MTKCGSCGRDLEEWHEKTGKWRCLNCAKEWFLGPQPEKSWASEPPESNGGTNAAT